MHILSLSTFLMPLMFEYHYKGPITKINSAVFARGKAKITRSAAVFVPTIEITVVFFSLIQNGDQGKKEVDENKEDEKKDFKSKAARISQTRVAYIKEFADTRSHPARFVWKMLEVTEELVYMLFFSFTH